MSPVGALESRLDPSASRTLSNEKLFDLLLSFPFLFIGSSEIVRGFGLGSIATSIESISVTLRSHEMTGDIVVGRVRVPVTRYEMEPRSNCVDVSIQPLSLLGGGLAYI